MPLRYGVQRRAKIAKQAIARSGLQRRQRLRTFTLVFMLCLRQSLKLSYPILNPFRRQPRDARFSKLRINRDVAHKMSLGTFSAGNLFAPGRIRLDSGPNGGHCRFAGCFAARFHDRDLLPTPLERCRDRRRKAQCVGARTFVVRHAEPLFRPLTIDYDLNNPYSGTTALAIAERDAAASTADSQPIGVLSPRQSGAFRSRVDLADVARARCSESIAIVDHGASH